jgi:hypothetical protein
MTTMLIRDVAHRKNILEDTYQADYVPVKDDMLMYNKHIYRVVGHDIYLDSKVVVVLVVKVSE